MSFRFKVTKTIQVKQFEPLTIEAEYTVENADTEEQWNKVAERLENFVRARLAKELRIYKGKARNDQ